MYCTYRKLTIWFIGELHLTPVRSTIQMRPALKYIDKIDEKFKAANKRIQDIEKDDAPAKKPAPSKAQALQVKERERESKDVSK